MNITMVARILVIAFILLGILNQPYEYYGFLRIFVSIVAISLTIIAFKKVNKTGFDYVYGVIAILYNPILPIYASKEIWVILNILTIIILGMSLAIDKGEFTFNQLIDKKTPQENNPSPQQFLNKKSLFIIILGSSLIFIFWLYSEQKEEHYLLNFKGDEYYENQGFYEDEYYDNQDFYEDEIITDEHNNETFQEYALNNKSEENPPTTLDEPNRNEAEEYYNYSDLESIDEVDFDATTIVGYFTLGSTQDEVQKIMGTPTDIYSNLNKWNYEYSSVDFNRNGKVIGWDDLSNTLKVKINKTTESNYFTLGSTKQDVVNAMGTPTVIYSSLNKWNYEYSSVDFDQNGKVVGWDDLSNALKVKINKTTESNYFSLGSTKQDVVNAMGTPTVIYSSLNKWNYEYSSVDFDQNGKVVGWDDFSKLLKVK